VGAAEEAKTIEAFSGFIKMGWGIWILLPPPDKIGLDGYPIPKEDTDESKG
jgi:hypothetical protein